MIWFLGLGLKILCDMNLLVKVQILKNGIDNILDKPLPLKLMDVEFENRRAHMRFGLVDVQLLYVSLDYFFV